MIPTHKTISVLHPYVNKKGGAVKMMIFLSNFLQEKNNDITFYNFSYDKNVFSEEAVHFRMKSFYNSGMLKFFNFLYIAFKIRKSDYVIIGNSPMHFVGVLSKVLFFSRAKLIWWNHHYPWYYSGNTNKLIQLKRIIEKRVIKRIDLVISNSQYLQSAIKDIYNLPSQILSPVLDRDFEKQIQKDKITHNGPTTIFTYGRWGEGKNIQLIFQTYESLKIKIPDLCLMVGGEGEELPYYCDKYENDTNVSFLGTIDNITIIDILGKSDIFLFPSLIDSFGLVLIESMSLGIPVVCLNKNGARELVQNGINGYLVDSDNEYIDRAYEILSNSQLKEKFSIASKYTAKRFTTSSFEKQLSHIFTCI